MAEMADRQIEAGISMRDAFEEWFEIFQEKSFYGYGAEVRREHESEYYKYFRNGVCPCDASKECFSARPCD